MHNKINRKYDPPTHNDAFTWLENSGECGQEVINYIHELKRTEKIKAVQAVITYFDDSASKSDDIHYMILATAASTLVENYLRDELQVNKDEQRRITETV